jgi:DNA polymerase-1
VQHPGEAVDDVVIKSVETLDEANEFMSWLGERRPVLAVDTETGGLEWWKVRLRLVQFGDAQTAWVLPWNRWAGLAIEALQRYTGQLVMHNAKFDCHMLEANAPVTFHPWHRIDDTRLMAHVLKPNEPTGLKPLAKRLIDPRAGAAQDVLSNAMAKQGWGWDEIPIDFPGYWAYAGLDAVYTARLWELFTPQLVQRNMWSVYSLDLCVSELLRRMEDNGCQVDLAYARANYDAYTQWCAQASQWVRDTYGVSPSSNVKLAERLIAEGIELTKRTGSGNISVDGEVLTGIDHPLAQTALRVRQISKVASTYLGNFLELADEDSVVHPSINPLGARTGRMSMSAPNLQNLPRDNRARPEALTVRNCFVPRDGNVLITADFDQIEQRMMAHYAYVEVGDRSMVDAFLAGGDFFTNMARNIYRDETLIKADPRRQVTKNAAYATGYGAGTEKFSQTAGITVEEGAAFMAQFHATYPGVKGFQRHTEQQAIAAAQEWGEPFVFDNVGRIHYADAGKLYTLVNYKIQGGAANVLKQKMIQLDMAGLGDYMILPIHDEVMFDVPREAARDVVATAQAVMPNTTDFAVPLTVGVDVVNRWGDKYAGNTVDLATL